jgi:hypothetical protein
MPHDIPYKAYTARATADIPIQFGKTTKNEAKRILGSPVMHSHDDTVWQYESWVTTSIGLWLPIIIPVHGGPIQSDQDGYGLFLSFGTDDILIDYDAFNLLDDEADRKLTDPERARKRSELRNLKMTAYESPYVLLLLCADFHITLKSIATQIFIFLPYLLFKIFNLNPRDCRYERRKQVAIVGNTQSSKPSASNTPSPKAPRRPLMPLALATMPNSSLLILISPKSSCCFGILR